MSRPYECTILIRSGAAREDYDGAVAQVRELFENEGARFSELDKWEERRLAYPIEGETSAVYLNGYFEAQPATIERIERRARLNDVILRQLIIARDEKSLVKIKDQRAKRAAAQAERAERAAAGAE